MVSTYWAIQPNFTRALPTLLRSESPSGLLQIDLPLFTSQPAAGEGKLWRDRTLWRYPQYLAELAARQRC